MQFLDPKTGEPVDDLAFCKALKEKAGVLLSPGSLCFGTLRDGDFKGFVRLHFTLLPEVFKKGLKRIEEFLEEPGLSSLSIKDEVNGGHANGTAH